ncbi:MAG: replication-associated recombination protein A [Clostridia bacterium]|nr:replication-associated recombination protein A [Clostridia bacterium]
MLQQPLADRIRPLSFEEMVGDPKLFGKDGIFPKMIAAKHIPNMIFYGPSGTGKTTAANILAKAAGKTLHKLNATSAGLADVKEVIAESNSLLGADGVLLYLDEMQYFNKKQQQSLLEYIENGKITLIASTTENPYFYIYPAIISRSAVFEFKPIESSALKQAVRRAADILREDGGRAVHFTEGALSMIVSAAAGDARRAVGLFENMASVYEEITEDTVRAFLPEVMGMSGFDKSGDGHYDLLSALQKSIRGSDPDAALFYLAKLLAGGDLISVCRRLQVIASEDVGLAYPLAVSVVRSCVESARELGLPEARIPLANAALLLATSPKSNSAEMGIIAASEAVAAGKGATFPRCLQNVHFDGENSDKKGQGYKYPHDYPNHYVPQQYLPDDLKGARFYTYGDNKTEQAAKSYWEKIKK